MEIHIGKSRGRNRIGQQGRQQSGSHHRRKNVRSGRCHGRERELQHPDGRTQLQRPTDSQRERKELQSEYTLQQLQCRDIDSQAKYLRMRKKGEEEQNDCITSPMPGKDGENTRNGRSGNESRRHRHRDRGHEDAKQL